MCALDVWKRTKSRHGGGGEGWRPIVYVMPKSNGKQAPPLSFAITPTVTREARHSPPSPLRKKSRFAKKSRLRRKKPRLPQKKLQHRMGGMPLPLPPSPPPTQCYPLYRFYSPPHSTIRQRIKCRGAIFCARPSMPPRPVVFTIFFPSVDAGAKYCAPTRGRIPSRQRLRHSHAPTCRRRHTRSCLTSYSRSFSSAKPTHILIHNA